MSTKKALGKGFDSLFPSDFDRSLLVDESERVQKLFIKNVIPDGSQPRQSFDESSISELASSIKRYGILQPLIVTTTDKSDIYQIIAGERRWRAAKMAGLEQVPAIVRTSQEQERLEIGLIENVQREDLSPLEQAASIYRLHDQFNLTYADIADRLGKAATTVNNIVRLLQLPAAGLEALKQGKISEGHARALLALKDSPKLQQSLLDSIIKNGWSVRQAEQFVVASKQGAGTSQEARKSLVTTTPETKKLSTLVTAPVHIKRTARGGELVIKFKDDADMQRIIDTLAK